MDDIVTMLRAAGDPTRLRLLLLLREAELERQRLQFEPAAFLSQLGLTPAEQAATRISLFCYPHAPVSALFDVWQNGARPLTCLVPEGVAAGSQADGGA